MASPAEAQPLTHEAERVSRMPVVWTTIWALLFAAVLSVVAVLLFHARSGMIAPAAAPPAPARPLREVSNVRSDLFRREGIGQELKQRQLHRIEQYEWLDRSRGLVRIPVDVAIDLEAAEQPR